MSNIAKKGVHFDTFAQELMNLENNCEKKMYFKRSLIYAGSPASA